MVTRISTASDWSRIIAIYNDGVATGHSTAETEPATLESKKAWLEDHVDPQFPIYVEEHAGHIRGWCSLSPYRCGRSALRHTAEISYYVGREHWRCGVASRLLDHAQQAAIALGYKSLFGILLDTNEPSIRLLEKHGFERWGHLPNVADFDGVECGHLYLGKRLV